MQKTTSLVLLSSLVVILALCASAAGLFWQASGSPFDFTPLRGASVQIYGQGLYYYDSAFRAPIFRGTDAATLFVAIPLLIAATLLIRRGGLRARLFHAGILSYFLYNAASVAFGVAYNSLFLLYIVYFSVSLFTFVSAMTSIPLADLAARISPRFKHGAVAAFLFVAGLSVLVWLIEILAGLAQGTAPAGMGPYHTEITAVIDIGLITPAAYLAAISLLRRKPLGYLLAPVLMILNALIGVVVLAQTAFQSLAGIVLEPGQVITYVMIFVVMGAFAVALSAHTLRNIQA